MGKGYTHNARGVMVLAARIPPISDQIVRGATFTPKLKVRRILAIFGANLMKF
jgi:hypothetical protein